MANILEQCKERLAELNALRPLTPEQELRVMQKLRLDWDFHSNHLEGNSLTYGETKALILHGLTAQGKPIKDHIEISGHHDAILLVEDLVRRKEPLTEQVIRQLHALILKEDHYIEATTPEGLATRTLVQVGSYKATANHVVTATGETLLFSSPLDTPIHMRELIEWYEKSQGSTEPLELSCVFHHRFTRIHPFADGNGRVARLVANFILMMGGYPPVIIKTGEKDSYFTALRLADADQPEAFMEYIGSRLLQSLDLVIRGARGETVEEADDTQKELALLRKKFETGAQKVNAVRTRELSQKAWASWIEPLFLEFERRAEGFRGFYLQYQTNLMIQGTSHNGPLPEQLAAGQTHVVEAREVYLVLQFSGIRSRKFVEVSFTQGLKLRFHATHVDILAWDDRKLGEVNWDETPEVPAMRSWIEHEEKRHLAFLKPRIEA